MRYLSITAMVLSVLCLPTSAAWLESQGTPPEIRLERSDWEAVRLSVEISDLAARSIEAATGEFTRLELSGESLSGKEGTPGLPVIRRILEVPFGAELSIQVEAAEAVEVALPGRLAPVQPPVPKLPGAREAMEFRYDPVAYQVDRVARPLARIVDEGILRGHRLVTLEIAPLSYRPADEQVILHPRLNVQIRLEGSDRLETARQDERFAALPFDDLLREVAPNALSYRTFTWPPAAPIGYLVICADDYVSNIQPWVAWKERRGFEVTVIPTSVAGSTTSAIKSTIQTEYNTGEFPPAYVLLVGDTNSIPCYNGEGSGSADDLAYSDLDGGGYWTPDVLLGRWPVRSSAQADIVVGKTLAVDQLDLPSLDHYKDSVWLASSDHASMLEATHEWCFANHVEPSDPVNNTYHAVYERIGGGTSDFASNVNAGRGIVCYSGHGYGDGSGTASVHFLSSNVNALTNQDEYPHVMVFACGTNLHNQTESFGETWLVAPNKGSVTYLGTSDSSYWDEDDAMQREIYRTMNVELYDLTAAYMAGLIKVYQQYQSSAAYYFDIYNLMGDPAMDLTTRIPMAVAIDAPDAVVPSPQTVEVGVSAGGSPFELALVAISMDGDLLGSAWTDSTGTALVDIDISEPGDLLIQVTGHDLVPTSAPLMVMAGGCGRVVLDRDGYNCDDQVQIQLFDADLAGTADVLVLSDSDPAGVPVTLTEVPPGEGEFTGSIDTTEGSSGAASIQVAHGDTLTVRYEDADCDGAPQTVNETAPVDCQGPAITGVQVAFVNDSSFTVEWTTDEAATTVLRYGTDPEQPFDEVSSAGLTTSHSITAEGLSPCTYYYYVPVSADGGGNLAVYDMGGAYLGLYTYEQQLMLDENMDTDPGWTGTGQWAWGHPTGSGGEHGNPDPSSGFTGQNVVGYNLNGDYGDSIPEYAMTTSSFDCSAASEVSLDYQVWLGVENNDYDHASLKVSGNGGSSWSTLWSNGGDSLDGGSWSASHWDISGVAAGSSDVQLRWTIGPTDSAWAYCGWNIDDVVVQYVGPCEQATPTPLPTFTPTPAVTATPEPTGTPTPEPTGTVIPGVGVRVEVPASMIHPGEEFWVRGHLDNAGAPMTDVPTFFMLQVGSAYYFWPSWCEYNPPHSMEIDYRELPVASGSTPVQVIPSFTWPQGVGSMGGLWIYGAMLDQGMTTVIGDIGMVEWGFAA